MNKIVLISGRAGAGKDTVADMLSNLIYNKGLEINSSYYACKIAFAEAVKQIARDLFDWNGKKDANGRKLLIFIGNYLGGEKYTAPINGYKTILDKYFTPDKDFWAKILVSKILDTTKDLKYILVPDFRYRKEYYYLKLIFPKLITIRVNRNVEPINDISETNLDNFEFNYTISNNAGVLELYDTCKKIASEIIR